MSLSDFHPDFLSSLQAQGYEELCVRGQAGLCGPKKFNYTWGLVVGMDAVSHDRRYGYEHRADAERALNEWDGTAHPNGPWIKCKGSRIDLLNPSFGLQVSWPAEASCGRRAWRFIGREGR